MQRDSISSSIPERSLEGVRASECLGHMSFDSNRIVYLVVPL